MVLNAIYLDCFSGISGNMLLGAFLDGGVPEEYIRGELEKLNIGHEFELKIDKVGKNGIHATHVEVELMPNDHNSHGHHHHRHLSDIVSIIEKSTLCAAVKEKSLAIFQRIAAAEAKVHGTTIEKVHFHEVGAVDSLVDIVGTAICLDYLQIEKIFVSKLNVGGGFVKCAHGLMPVPAPATAELLKGIPFYGGPERELVTPTGAAVVAVLADRSGFELPENFSYETVAYGAGTWDIVIPNVLRLYIGSIADTETKKNF